MSTSSEAEETSPFALLTEYLEAELNNEDGPIGYIFTAGDDILHADP
jgi:hypothetical protein